MLKKLVVAALFATGLSTPALAQDRGWHLGLRTGVADLNDPDFTLTDPSTSDRLDTVLKTDGAWGFGGEVGYDFGAVRAGLEITYQSNKVKGVDFHSLNGVALTASDVQDVAQALVDAEVIDPDALNAATLNGTTISGSVGKLEQVALMANVTYTLPVGDKIKPYVGFGAGTVGTHVKLLGDDDGVVSFAWQARAGAAVQLSPRASLTADYTYRQAAAGDLSFGDNDVDLRLGKTSASLIMVGLHFAL